MLWLSSADFSSKLTFSKDYFLNTIRVSNGLNPDQDQSSMGPDLGPTCLERLSVAASKESVKDIDFWLATS